MNNYMIYFNKLKNQNITIEEFEKYCDDFMFQVYKLNEDEIDYIRNREA